VARAGRRASGARARRSQGEVDIDTDGRSSVELTLHGSLTAATAAKERGLREHAAEEARITVSAANRTAAERRFEAQRAPKAQQAAANEAAVPRGRSEGDASTERRDQDAVAGGMSTDHATPKTIEGRPLATPYAAAAAAAAEIDWELTASDLLLPEEAGTAPEATGETLPGGGDTHIATGSEPHRTRPRSARKDGRPPLAVQEAEAHLLAVGGTLVIGRADSDSSLAEYTPGDDGEADGANADADAVARASADDDATEATAVSTPTEHARRASPLRLYTDEGGDVTAGGLGTAAVSPTYSDASTLSASTRGLDEDRLTSPGSPVDDSMTMPRGTSLRPEEAPVMVTSFGGTSATAEVKLANDTQYPLVYHCTVRMDADATSEVMVPDSVEVPPHSREACTVTYIPAEGEPECTAILRCLTDDGSMVVRTIRCTAIEAHTSHYTECVAAATKIQSSFRGKRARDTAKRARRVRSDRERAATVLQSRYRGKRVRDSVKARRAQQKAAQVAEATLKEAVETAAAEAARKEAEETAAAEAAEASKKEEEEKVAAVAALAARKEADEKAAAAAAAAAQKEADENAAAEAAEAPKKEADEKAAAEAAAAAQKEADEKAAAAAAEASKKEAEEKAAAEAAEEEKAAPSADEEATSDDEGPPMMISQPRTAIGVGAPRNDGDVVTHAAPTADTDDAAEALGSRALPPPSAGGHGVASPPTVPQVSGAGPKASSRATADSAASLDRPLDTFEGPGDDSDIGEELPFESDADSSIDGDGIPLGNSRFLFEDSDSDTF